MNENKKIREQRKQRFLLTFFDEDKYTEKEVNGFILVKSFNSDYGHWQVAIFEKDNFKKYKNFTQVNLLES